MPPGRGPGRGRGPSPGRRVAGRAARNAAAARHAPPPPAEEAKKEEAAEAPPKKQEVSYDCEFPRCDKPSEYGFKDEGAFPQFCVEHKSDEMTLLVPDPEHPKESSLERVRQYQKMEPELEALREAPAKAAACKAEIKKLSGDIHKEDDGIKQLTQAIGELDAGLASQAKKPKLRGKTLFGKGLLAQDQDVIDKLTKDKEGKVGKVVELKGDKEINESRLNQLKEDLQGLDKDAAEYASIEKTMKGLKAAAVEAEASGLYLQLKAKGMPKEMNAEGEVISIRLVGQA